MNIETREDGYYCIGEKSPFRISNFTITGKYLMTSSREAARMLTLKNEFGSTATILISSKDFASLQTFKVKVESIGNFNWLVTGPSFQEVKQMIFQECLIVEEVVELGWQPDKKIYAFSNGVFYGSTFHYVDNYGIIKINDIGLLIPAWSEMFKNTGEFKEERKFKHTERKIDLKTWAKLYVGTFGVKAYVGISYLIACVNIGQTYFLRFNFYRTQKIVTCTMDIMFPNLFGKRRPVVNANTCRYKNQIPF